MPRGANAGGGKEGQELFFILNSFHLLSCNGAFSDVVDSLVEENFSRGTTPELQHTIRQL